MVVIVSICRIGDHDRLRIGSSREAEEAVLEMSRGYVHQRPRSLCWLSRALSLRSSEVSEGLIPCALDFVEAADRHVNLDVVEVECNAVEVDGEYAGDVVAGRHTWTAGNLGRLRKRTRPRCALRLNDNDEVGNDCCVLSTGGNGVIDLAVLRAFVAGSLRDKFGGRASRASALGCWAGR